MNIGSQVQGHWMRRWFLKEATQRFGFIIVLCSIVPKSHLQSPEFDMSFKDMLT